MFKIGGVTNRRNLTVLLDSALYNVPNVHTPQSFLLDALPIYGTSVTMRDFVMLSDMANGHVSVYG